MRATDNTIKYATSNAHTHTKTYTLQIQRVCQKKLEQINTHLGN
jgi:hypothetical protein